MKQRSSDHFESLIDKIIVEAAACVRQVSGMDMAYAGALVEAAPRIFVAGAGRTGLCMCAFAMRLMHLGKTVYVVGETTTPSIAEGDLLILGSGSGRTATLLAIAERARRKNSNILLFTADAASPLAELADHHVLIPAPSPRSSSEGESLLSIQPMGTLFEQTLLILSDSLIVTLMQGMGVDVDLMSGRHANLE